MKFVGEDQDGNEVIYDTWRELAASDPYAQLNFSGMRQDQLRYLEEKWSAVVPTRDFGDGIYTVDMPINPAEVEGVGREKAEIVFASHQLRLVREHLDKDWSFEEDAKTLSKQILEELYSPFEGLQNTFLTASKVDQKRELTSKSYGWLRAPTPSGSVSDWCASDLKIKLDKHLGWIHSDSILGKLLLREIEPFTLTWYAASALYEIEMLKHLDGEDALNRTFQVGRWYEAMLRKTRDRALNVGVKITSKKGSTGMRPKTQRTVELLRKFAPDFPKLEALFEHVRGELAKEQITKSVCAIKKNHHEHIRHKK